MQPRKQTASKFDQTVTFKVVGRRDPDCFRTVDEIIEMEIEKLRIGKTRETLVYDDFKLPYHERNLDPFFVGQFTIYPDAKLIPPVKPSVDEWMYGVGLMVRDGAFEKFLKSYHNVKGQAYFDIAERGQRQTLHYSVKDAWNYAKRELMRAIVLGHDGKKLTVEGFYKIAEMQSDIRIF